MKNTYNTLQKVCKNSEQPIELKRSLWVQTKLIMLGSRDKNNGQSADFTETIG